MATEKPTFVYDGFASVAGGVNAGVAETFVPPGQLSNAINLACRGARAKNRPGFISQPLTYLPTYATNGTTVTISAAVVKASFEGGYFQGAGEYRYQREVWLYAMVAGRLFRLTPMIGLWTVEDVTPDAGNDPTRTKAYFCQCNNILVVQDGQGVPLLVKARSVYRSDLAKNQIPTGTYMAHGYGRTIVCTGPRSYKIGDLIGEVPDAEVSFIDNTYLAENADFSAQPSMGNVVGIIFLQVQDTTTGDGPALIVCENGIESLLISNPRTTWQKSGIQVEALTATGGTGPMAIVNGDLWFRSQDGWRSFQQTRGDQKKLNQVPQSNPVRPYIDAEYLPQSRFGSAINFNNRLLATCGPQRCAGGCVHSGLLSLDFDVITNGITDDEKPAWDGFWTLPVPVAQLITAFINAEKRAFAFTSKITFASDGTAQTLNGLCEIIEDAQADTLGYGTDGAPVNQLITTVVETRALNASASVNLSGLSSVDQLAFFTEKRLEFADVFETQRRGDTLLTVEFRGDGDPDYLPLASFAESAPQAIAFNSDNTLSISGPRGTVEQRSFTPADNATGTDARIDRRFFYAVFRITFTGSLQIERFRFAAVVLPDSRRAGRVI